MLHHDLTQLEVERLLFELSYCVNGLHGYRRQLSIDDAQQDELSLQKLSALTSSVNNQSGQLRLVAV